MYTISRVTFLILALGLGLACNAAPISDNSASKTKPQGLSTVFVRSQEDESQQIHPPPTGDNKDVTVAYAPGLGTPRITARAPQATNENGNSCLNVCANTLRLKIRCNLFMAQCGCQDFTGSQCQISDFTRPSPPTELPTVD